MKTAKHQRGKPIALGAVLSMALLALVPQSHALDSLTNGVLAYWPMDTINGGVITPDLGPNGFDLKPYNGNAPVAFNGANVPLSAFTGPHANVNGNQNGTNALSTSTSQNTMLGYIASPGSIPASTNLSVPPLNLPNSTISFWLKAAQGGGNSGNRMFDISEVPLGNPGNLLWDISQYGTDNSQIDHFRRHVGGTTNNGVALLDDNGGGDHIQTTNAVIFDNNWHNVTIISKLTTNMDQPVIDPTQFGTPANGYVAIAWVSEALDTLYPNWLNQVETNQNYKVQVATNIAGPWVTIGTVGGNGNGTSQIFDDNSPTNTYAFYRVVKPLYRLIDRFLYIDGKLTGNSGGDSIDPYLGQGALQSTPAKTGGNYRFDGWYIQDSLTFGGYYRAAGEGGYVNASFSDAAIWNRALSTNELASYIRDGITNASVFAAPLFASLSAEFPAAVQGDADLLSWSAAKPPATLALFPGYGNVTPVSSLGNGSSNAIVNSNTVFSLVASRSGLSATGAVSVICVSNVAPNWRFIDNFSYLSDGPVGNQGGWQNPNHGPSTTPPTYMLDAQVYTTAGNNYLGFDGYDINVLPGNVGGGAIAGRDLFSLANNFSQTNTLFFRFYIPSAATNTDPNFGGVTAFQYSVGLSDIGIIDTAINGGLAGGPSLTLSQPAGGGPIDLAATSGGSSGGAGVDGITTSPGGYDFLTDPNTGNTNGLIADHVYNVWIDVINNFRSATDSGSVNGYGVAGEQTNAVYYAVWLQRDDWTQRTNLFMDISCTNNWGGLMNGVVYPQGYLLSQRDYAYANQVNNQYGPSANLKYLFLQQANAPTQQSTNSVLFDDFFMSKTGTGFNSTVPVTVGSFPP